MEQFQPRALTADERAELDARRREYDSQIDVVRSERGQGLAEKTTAHAEQALGAGAVGQSLEVTD